MYNNTNSHIHIIFTYIQIHTHTHTHINIYTGNPCLNYFCFKVVKLGTDLVKTVNDLI